jgi:hypothetical protein
MHAKQLIKIGLMTTALFGMTAQAVAQRGEGGHGGGGNRGGWSGQRGGGMNQGSMTPRGMGENRPAPVMQAPQQSMPSRNYQSQAPRSVDRSNSQAGQVPQQQVPQQPRQGWSGDQGRSGNDWQRPNTPNGQDGQYRRGWDNGQSNADRPNRDQANRDQAIRNQANQARDRNWSNNDPNRNGVNGNRNWNAQSRDWNDRNRNPQVNGQYSAGRQDWGDRSGGRDWRYQPSQRLNDRDRWDGFRRWDNKDWRRDTRYNWQDYRRSHGSLYRLPSYYAPSGWYGGYSRFSIGIFLNNILFGSNYWINDPFSYRLPPAYGPLRWVRYYDDALLVDVRDGYVVDVIHDFFW